MFHVEASSVLFQALENSNFSTGFTTGFHFLMFLNEIFSTGFGKPLRNIVKQFEKH
jgi:hypothetical protein